MKTTLAILSLLLIGVLWVNKIEPVEVTRIVKVEVPVIVEKPVEKVIPIYIDRVTSTMIYPQASKAELIWVYGAIEYGIYAHQYYVDNPSLQTPVTGSTEFNQGQVRTYFMYRDLLERAYGRIK